MEKQTQLELKHLAAYLPYGLKMIFNLVLAPTNLKPDNITRALNHQYKPILRPLSDLPKPIQANPSTTWLTLINLDSNEYFNKDLSFDVSGNDSFLMKDAINIYEILLQWHFDVFGLIDAGLALDINTLNK